MGLIEEIVSRLETEWKEGLWDRARGIWGKSNSCTSEHAHSVGGTQ